MVTGALDAELSFEPSLEEFEWQDHNERLMIPSMKAGNLAVLCIIRKFGAK